MPSYEHHLDRNNPRYLVPHYRAIVIDDYGQAIDSFEIDATEDEAALAVARQRAGSHVFDFLDGMYIVGRYWPLA